MDIKHVLSRNPLQPAYAARRPAPRPRHPAPPTWIEHAGGPVEIGHGGDGFGFDNEFPRHPVHLEPFALADRPVTCGEWLAFIDDGGYRRPELWLSDGWATVQAEGWEAPLYWSGPTATTGDEFTLAGDRAGRPGRAGLPVSYYEADAFARWAGPACPPRPSGRRWPRAPGRRGRRATFLDHLGRSHPAPGRRPRAASASSATSGSGPRAPTAPTRASARARRGRRVQRQVHGQPVRAARRLAA